MLFGPALELGHRHFVEGFFYHRGSRGRPPEDRGGKAIRVTVKADHPLDRFYFFIYLIS
jgi:hypothetical protein